MTWVWTGDSQVGIPGVAADRDHNESDRLRQTRQPTTMMPMSIFMKRLTGWIWPALLLLAAVVVSATTRASTHVEQIIARHEQPLLLSTLGLAALGFTMMMGGVLSLLMATGEPISHEEVEGSSRRNRDMPARACTRGARRPIECSAWARACRAGLMHRLPASRRPGAPENGSATSTGAVCSSRQGEGTLLLFGLFGVFVVVGPMPVKLLVAGAMAYAAARTVWGLARA